MQHLGTKLLKTERLTLRPFVLADAPAMYRNWAADPEVTRFLMWPPHESLAVSEAVLRDWIAGYARANYYQWAIVYRELDEPIGSISVNTLDEQTASAHIGYCIGRDWWHRGITTEALQAVIDFLFDEVGVLRVESRHDPRNPHSGAVMQKCGMRYEGTLRRADWNNRGICDACYYGLLAEEHAASRTMRAKPTSK